MSVDRKRGLVDTNIVILRHRIDPSLLPDELAICTITLAELSAGVQLVVGDDRQARTERSNRAELLQQVEHEFDPIPFDEAAGRAYGRVVAAVSGVGRSTRRRSADLMIAAVATSQGLPLYTTNPDDFVGLDGVTEICAIPRPRP